MDLYREQILDHYKNPRHFGVLKDPDVTIEEYNSFCGDRIRIDIKLNDAKKESDQKVSAMVFSGEGCAISIAAASLLLEYGLGKDIATLKAFKPDDMIKLLGIKLTPTRLQCALLSWEVMKKTLQHIQ